MSTCPRCGGADILVQYMAPLAYECRSCGARLRDANRPGIPVLTEEEARQKRPALYGLPVCSVCTHKAHKPDETPAPLAAGTLIRRRASCGTDCPVCAEETREVRLELR